MKILITTDLYSVTTNGVVASVRNLCRELEKKGHQVRILTLSKDRHSYTKGNVTYIRSLSLSAIYPNVRMATSYHHRLIRDLVTWKPNIIHSQCEFFSFQFARYISKCTGAPIVHTYHTLYEQYVPYLIPNRFLGKHIVRTLSRTRLRNVNTIIAPTQKVEKALRGYGLGNTIRVVPSGIDLRQHQAPLSADRRLALRHSLGIKDDQQVVLSLGRLGVEKNLTEILELFAAALAQNDKLVFLIVGDGPDREHLEQRAKELAISDHVIFAGMVDPSAVQDYYQVGDVFVSASTSETQGLTYIEAAANGLPLLCRKDDCLNGVIRQGENGYEYTCKESFLENLFAVLEDPDWRLEAGKRSKEIADAFSTDAFGASVEAVYQSALTEGLSAV